MCSTLLRTRRLELNLTIDELGRRTGIERSILSRAERGYCRLKQDQLARLAHHLGLELEQVLAIFGEAGGLPPTGSDS